MIGFEKLITTSNSTCHGDCFEVNIIHSFGSNDNLPSVSPNHEVCELTLSDVNSSFPRGAIDMLQAPSSNNKCAMTIMLHNSNLQNGHFFLNISKHLNHCQHMQTKPDLLSEWESILDSMECM
ncbi:hypothetical protein ACJMK2_032674 [Sinanodonta woodiana]|uniref:Uncharacterized protein n=1 Tax=Sinanodonta woodiana TaxID=1069815 RepID=A0ABD3X318_SINWO